MAVAVLHLCLAGGAWAQLDPLCTLSDERYRVELDHLGTCCPAEMRLLIEERDSGEVHQVRVRARMQRVLWMRILNDSTLTMVGSFGAGKRSILLVDLDRSGPHDEIWTYGHRFSPSKRYLAYLSFYPTTVEPDLQRSILLLYQLQRPPERNRLSPTSVLEPGNAGIPIFPQRNVTERSYDPRLEAKHVVLSPLLWSQDETRIVFLESFAGDYRLVTVDLSRSLESPRSAHLTVSPSQFLDDTDLRSATRESNLDGRLAVTNLRFTDPETVVLDIQGGSDLKERLELRVP